MNIVAFRSNKGGEVAHSRESGNLAVPSNHSLHFQLQSRGRKKKHENVDSQAIAKLYFEKAIQYLIQS